MMPPEYLTMGEQEFKSKKGERLRELFDFVFGFENKKGEVLDYWMAFHDKLAYPPQEFYDAVANELEVRKVPGLQISREEFVEGGLLSEKRIYLRFFRERLAVYTCAAPFGIGYFYSCRVVYVPALIRLWHILAALFFFNFIGALLVRPLGIMFASIAEITLIFALVAVMRNVATAAFADLDTLLLKIPGLATIYESWFRADTYYRTDTRAIYLKKIPEIVKAVAEEITAAKGTKLVQQYEFAPIFGELYKPIRPKPGTE
ncbi:MAG TPA: hypothetical protein VH597_06260 [Verrucomicrobiae bacterium]|jgi:hypothetical protein|nr:hypothetical protein [Verrucomicrobiae bacterium]